MTQPKLGEQPVCPACGSQAMLPARDKDSVFWVCSSCSWGRERAIKAKRRKIRRGK